MHINRDFFCVNRENNQPNRELTGIAAKSSKSSLRINRSANMYHSMMAVRGPSHGRRLVTWTIKSFPNPNGLSLRIVDRPGDRPALGETAPGRFPCASRDPLIRLPSAGRVGPGFRRGSDFTVSSVDQMIRQPSRAGLTLSRASTRSAKVEGISSKRGVALVEGDAAPARGMVPHLRVSGSVPPSTPTRAARGQRSAALLGRRRVLRKSTEACDWDQRAMG